MWIIVIVLRSHVYRTSSLTKVLADAFICGERGSLAVICTASPCASDTEHSIGTLRLAAVVSSEEKEGRRPMFLCVCSTYAMNTTNTTIKKINKYIIYESWL